MLNEKLKNIKGDLLVTRLATGDNNETKKLLNTALELKIRKQVDIRKKELLKQTE